jgi:hypothetical protein
VRPILHPIDSEGAALASDHDRDRGAVAAAVTDAPIPRRGGHVGVRGLPRDRSPTAQPGAQLASTVGHLLRDAPRAGEKGRWSRIGCEPATPVEPIGPEVHSQVGEKARSGDGRTGLDQ